MPDEINFMDLASLLSIGPDTTLEKLGSSINASIFDASNTAGGLKQKGLIDFTASYPGPNTVTVTDAGKALIAEAEAKGTSPYDDLDDAILMQVSGGKRMPLDLQNTLNIRPKDLALRIYKLYKQGFITYDLKSGGVYVLLTDAGFLKSKAAMANLPKAQQPQSTPVHADPAAQKEEKEMAADMPRAPKKSKTLIILVIILIIIVVAGAYYLNLIKKL